MKITTIALPVALALAATTAAAQEKAQGVRLSATLTGAAEVGPNGQTGVGDPDGTGSFSGRLVPGQGQLCYTLTSANVTEVKMAHIHTGAAGTNGPPVVNLDITAGEHCMTIDKAVATALVAKPADYYVNVHTADKMAGAVRGQLVKN